MSACGLVLACKEQDHSDDNPTICMWFIKLASFKVDFKVPAKIMVWFLETSRFLAVFIRVPWILFGFWMGKRCCTLKPTLKGPYIKLGGKVWAGTCRSCGPRPEKLR